MHVARTIIYMHTPAIIRPQNIVALNTLLTSINPTESLANLYRNGFMRTYGSLQWNQAQISSFQKATSDGYFNAVCYNANGVSADIV